MGDAFGAQHRELAAGAAKLGELPGRAADLLGQVRQALTGAAGAAGNVGLAKALMETDLLATAVQGTDLRGVKMFGLGDQDRPLQAVVVESPVPPPPGDFKHIARLGPLGWFYRYTLVSPATAADILVRWTDLALPRRGKGHVITTFRHPWGSGLTGDVVTISRKRALARNGKRLDAGTLREVVGGLVAVS